MDLLVKARKRLLIAPQMAPIHFVLLERVLRAAGLRLVIVPKVTKEMVDWVLPYVNNDMCYPAILTIASVCWTALNSGHDLQDAAIVMTETGGGCRASQYASIIRKVLAKLGHPEVPVVVLAFAPRKGEAWNQLGLRLGDARQAMYALLLGDLLMVLSNRIRPYEETAGRAEGVLKKFLADLAVEDGWRKMDDRKFAKTVDDIVKVFSYTTTRIGWSSKPKIGVVGEILLKYHPDGNNELVKLIESEGCEAVVSPLNGFFSYSMFNSVIQSGTLGRSKVTAMVMRWLINFVEKRERVINRALARHKQFEDLVFPSIWDLSKKEKLEGIIPPESSMGEGWLLPAEIVELVEHGCPHVVVAQPFGCLPNHQVAAGTIRPIRARYPDANICVIDYDCGASGTNQVNRIKLLAEQAKAYHEKKSFNKQGDDSRPITAVGIDVGSTTLKCVVIGVDGKLEYAAYERHDSNVRATILAMLRKVADKYGERPIAVVMSGSGALGLARSLEVKYVQEVIATGTAVRALVPGADAVIEIGGEDAKFILLQPGGNDLMRMNDSCAGGTGAFLDQMAALLRVDADGLNELAKGSKLPRSGLIQHGGTELLVQIASRCGVFAKTDIQALMNRDVPLVDMAVAVYRAIARQVIGQLAKGDLKVGQRVALLGGPLRFSSKLRKAFVQVQEDKQTFVCPENAEYFVAIGAALSVEDGAETTFGKLCRKLEELPPEKGALDYLPPLFENVVELEEFRARHPKFAGVSKPVGMLDNIYIGIDAGSTTRKAVFIDDDGEVVWSIYDYNDGRVTDFAEKIARVIREKDLKVAHVTAIGYGEDVLVDAGLANSGVVETEAHLRAAQELYGGDIDYIVDVGGQDVKVFRFANGELREVQLNEACSSGCGSFIKTFMDTLGLTPEQFDDLACRAEHPINLGSRCTVFMNSGVKNAQRHAAELADIAAGLMYSIVFNLLNKVVKGKLTGRVIAQGGTLWNDGVCRALEIVTGAEVIRPEMSGLMGAYGAALIARDKAFDPMQSEAGPTTLNMVDFKLKLLLDRQSPDNCEEGEIGIPLALGMYENYPYWHALFSALGMKVIHSDVSTSRTYDRGAGNVPSGTVCYPAKLLHGHVIDLVEKGIKRIWMPFVKWEIAEDPDANNHFNCPVVMGYPYAARANMTDYLLANGVEMYADPLPLDKPWQLIKVLAGMKLFEKYTAGQLFGAVNAAVRAREEYHAAIRAKGEEILRMARSAGVHSIVLAGHPYHIDPEVNHGMAGTINRLGMAVLTEDSVAHLVRTGRTGVSNQWVYHGRLYRAARFVAMQDDVDLIHVVSFGCGLDAVTTTEVQDILEQSGKTYTLIKVDDVRDVRPLRLRVRALKERLRAGMRVRASSGGVVG